MNKFVRFVSIGFVVAAGTTLVPLAANAEPAETEDVQSTSEAIHAGGRFFERVLADVELRPEQRTEVDKLVSEAKARHAPVREARRDLMLELADQIEDNKIDSCALDPKIKAVAAAVAKAHPGDRAAFERFHSILDKEQRTKFVDSMKKNIAAALRAHEPRAMLTKLAEELQLTDEQKDRFDKIGTALRELRDADPAHAERRAEKEKVLEAFKGDRFVLDEIAPARDVEEKITKRIAGRLTAAEAVLDVLTDEQRTKLAEKIRSRVREREASASEREREGELSPMTD